MPYYKVTIYAKRSNNVFIIKSALHNLLNVSAKNIFFNL